MPLGPATEASLQRPDVRASEYLAEICRATLQIYPPGGAKAPWLGYLAEVDGAVIGSCAFKSPPAGGRVEIAYLTLPEFEGRGHATAMAARLVAIARDNGVALVTAQTLPQASASTRILEKLGFARHGSVMHPEDGEVWEWRLV